MVGKRGKSGRKKSGITTTQIFMRVPKSEKDQFFRLVPHPTEEIREFMRTRSRVAIEIEQSKLHGLLEKRKEIETEYLMKQESLGTMMDQIVKAGKAEEIARTQKDKLLTSYQNFLSKNNIDPVFAWQELSGEIAEDPPFERALISSLSSVGLPTDLNIIRSVIKKPIKKG
jgi:hypothetical protein